MLSGSQFPLPFAVSLSLPLCLSITFAPSPLTISPTLLPPLLTAPEVLYLTQHLTAHCSLFPSFQCSPSFLIILLFLRTLKRFPHSKIITDFHLSLFISNSSLFYYPSFPFSFLLQVTYTDQCPSAAMPAPWLQLPGISVSQDPPSQHLTWCNKQIKREKLRGGGKDIVARVFSNTITNSDLQQIYRQVC